MIENAFSQTALSGSPLKRLLQLAEEKYPLLKAKALQIKAAEKGVDASKSSFIPSLDAAYQVNYATYNNITGMANPQFIIPISGPPSAGNNYSGVFGSSASLLINWQPITFGLRESQVAVAQSGMRYAIADADNEIFQHKIKLINAYLDELTAVELEKIFEENISRTQANLNTAKVLVINGIKPGVDTALLIADLTRARVDELNSKKSRIEAHINLTTLLATDSTILISDTSYFNILPALYNPADTAKNTLLSLYNASLDVSRYKRKALAKTTMPTLGIWGTGYGRGSGIDNTGNVKSADGLAFQRFNYGVGLQLSVPILQRIKIKSQLERQDYFIKSNSQKLEEISLQLRKQNELADTSLHTALAVAKASPLYYESAVFAYRALESRYKSGLANYADLIQAQYALVKATVERKTAYISVWKALLFKASVNGDLNLFLNQVN